MQWTDRSIVLSARKYGENSAVLRVFARAHGVYGGVVRGAQSKSMRGVAQPGNVVNAVWQARLQEQLGGFRMELLEPTAALLMQDAQRLAALTAICSLMEAALPERHPYIKLYNALESFLHILKTAENWQEDYVRLELALLAEAGFGLDLRRCAATGNMEELAYVSPKSGRAVSREAGRPYHDKLLPLPPFLADAISEKRARSAEILDGMRLTGYFLEHWLLMPHRRKLPAARVRLPQILDLPQSGMKESNAAETHS